MTDKEIATAILHGTPHTLSGREREICENLADGGQLTGDGVGIEADGTIRPAGDDYSIFRQLEMLHIADLARWHNDLQP